MNSHAYTMPFRRHAAMKCLVLLLALVASAFSSSLFADLRSEWEAWKETHGKTYNSDDEDMNRFEVWADHRDFVNEQNSAANASFTLGINEFADMTVEEFRSAFLGYSPEKKAKKHCSEEAHNRTSSLPDSVDWRTKGYVTEVKNQGNCGSCWAFSTTGSLEGQHFKKTGNLVSLSEQDLVDCSKKEGNDGCEGGLMELGFEYVENNGGIDTEASYPYKAKDGRCHYKPAKSGATCTGCVKIKAHSESDLQSAVATVGPISVAMDAHLRSFMLYKEGIYYSEKCSSTKLDHGVLAVGYGTQGGDDYWLVKNSWGAHWGLKGYFMLARNKDNACGVATDASYPLV